MPIQYFRFFLSLWSASAREIDGVAIIIIAQTLISSLAPFRAVLGNRFCLWNGHKMNQPMRSSGLWRAYHWRWLMESAAMRGGAGSGCSAPATRAYCTVVFRHSKRRLLLQWDWRRTIDKVCLYVVFVDNKCCVYFHSCECLDPYLFVCFFF